MVLKVPVSFHPEATAELEVSADWYAQQNPHAARDFCVAADIAMENIAADPERFVKIDARHHACSALGVPFQIVFRHDAQHVYVVAVAHSKRRPGYWRGR